MKIVLLENVKNIGKTGDIKDVADGYARNFLLPRKMAETATPEAVQRVQKISADKVQKEKEDLERTQQLASKIDGMELTIKAKEKDGKLFGSIGAKEIIEALEKQDVTIEEKSVMLKEPIKKVGEKEITVQLDHGIEAKLTLIVAGE